MFVYIGTFTDGFMGGAIAQGLYVYRVDGTKTPRLVQIVEGLHSPSFIARHPRLPMLYAAERAWSAEDASEGALSTFWIDPQTGRLELMQRRRSGGASTAHVCVSEDGGIVATANPLGPSLASFPLDAAGAPLDWASLLRFEGQGARPRQSAPWPHAACSDRDGRRLFVCDLGLDRVSIYDIDRSTGALAPGPLPWAQVSSGAGARHLTFGSDGRFVYVVNELDSTLSVFEYDAARGSLAICQTLRTTPPQFEAANQPAELVFAPSGRSLYVTNRGHDSIAIFDVDANSGRLAPRQFVPCGGSVPRHIAIAPDGRSAFVSNQLSARVEIFDIEPGSGELRTSGRGIDVPSPACVVVFGRATS